MLNINTYKFNNYPSEEELKYYLLNCWKDKGIDFFVQQWLSEGVPFIFQDYPFLFESLRFKLAKELSLNSKEITIVGSARLGYSLTPPPKFGTRFNSSSDMDFALVSSLLFKKCEIENNLWKIEYKSGKAIPNKNEKDYWDSNFIHNDVQINRGFIDSNKIPNRYATIKSINNLRWYLEQYLSNNKPSLSFKKINFRIYSDWDCFLKQQKININDLKYKLSG